MASITQLVVYPYVYTVDQSYISVSPVPSLMYTSNRLCANTSLEKAERLAERFLQDHLQLHYIIWEYLLPILVAHTQASSQSRRKGRLGNEAYYQARSEFPVFLL